MKEDDKFYYWDKGERTKLTDNFSTQEFDCQCHNEDCVEQKMSKDCINRLQEIRTEIGCPLNVTSAFRCAKHQEEIRNSGESTVVAKKKSTHEDGEAADVTPRSKTIDELLTVSEKHFTSIGLASTFIHLDTRPGYRRWNY